MKKLFGPGLCLALCLLLLLPLAAPCAADGETLIYDAAGLAAIGRDPSGRYALAADIDLGGLDWTPVAFSGTLDGRGHTIYNLRVTRPGEELRVTRDGNLKPYDTAFAGLFSVLENAELRDVHLKGAFVELESSQHCFAALLAGYFDHSSVTNCSVEGRVYLTGKAVMVGVGGLLGYGCGAISDCSADVELFFEDRFDGRCEQFMGGLFACGIADIDRCSVAIQGYDSCHGYVHDGGMVGMYYLCGMDFHPGSFTGNRVSGQISFFEDNPDRRAYCEPDRGEWLTVYRTYDDNRFDFKRNETFDYSRVLLPESCAEPALEEETQSADCENWGFTRHVCRKCGRSWTDSYTPPAHSPGDWVLVDEPAVGREGRERQSCRVCGALLDERTLPALAGTESCTLDCREATLRPRETLILTATVLPADAPEGAVYFSSSDESVAVVDANGRVTAVGPGSAAILAETADGLNSDFCAITVRNSLFQWLRSLFRAR